MRSSACMSLLKAMRRNDMFHTILNMYDVFKPYDESYEREKKTYNGYCVDVFKVGENEYIDRLYSTNPYDYLNKDIYPFKKI